MLYFPDAYSVDVEHEFAFDDVVACADSFGILDDSLAALAIGVDKIGDIAASMLDGAVVKAMGRDKQEGNLLAEVGDQAGALEHAESDGTGVLLA